MLLLNLNDSIIQTQQISYKPCIRYNNFNAILLTIYVQHKYVNSKFVSQVHSSCN